MQTHDSSLEPIAKHGLNTRFFFWISGGGALPLQELSLPARCQGIENIQIKSSRVSHGEGWAVARWRSDSERIGANIVAVAKPTAAHCVRKHKNNHTKSNQRKHMQSLMN